MKKEITNFNKIYLEKALPEMREKLGIKNTMALPRLLKIIVAAGVAKHAKEGKFLEDVEEGVKMLTGQKTVRTVAKKSIAGFKLREGQISGIKVTLRGKRMEEFVYKLINVVLPRVRDFRGVSVKNFDGAGNLSFGVREAQAFPEVDPQKIETIFGLQITIVTTAETKQAAEMFFKSIGFPLTSAEVTEAEQSGKSKKQKKGKN